jgi:transposase
MLKPRSPQASFYGSYLYDKIVPADHLLRRINQVVDFSFVQELVKDRYNPDFGRPAEDPEFMIRVCLLQYLYGDSDRGVIENTRLNLAYKYFLGLAIDEEVPDDTTISYFRSQRLGETKFRQVFEQIVQQCKDKGLVKGKRQIIDSTHIVADMAVTSLTGLIKLCRRNVLKTVKKQDAKLAEKLGLKDMQFTKKDKFTRMEDDLEEEVKQAESLLDVVTTELKNKRLRVTPELQKDLEILEKAVADRDDKAKDRLVSPVDPDARAGNKQHKHWVGYKGHVIIEEDSEIITAVDTTPGNQVDSSQFKPLLDQQKTAFSLTPEEISGDKGYDTVANLEHLDGTNTKGYISLTKKTNAAGAQYFTVDSFLYDANQDTLMCPACHFAPFQRRAVFHYDEQVKRGTVFQFRPDQCNFCELKPLCYKGNRGRSVYISYYEPLFRQMKERMASEEGKAAYRNRYKVEHKIADLARWCGMRRCRYRGLLKAKTHTLLSAIASNVKRMARLLCPHTGKVCPLFGLVSQNMAVTC